MEISLQFLLNSHYTHTVRGFVCLHGIEVEPALLLPTTDPACKSHSPPVVFMMVRRKILLGVSFNSKQLLCEEGPAACWTRQWHRAWRGGLAGSHPFHVPFSRGTFSLALGET